MAYGQIIIGVSSALPRKPGAPEGTPTNLWDRADDSNRAVSNSNEKLQ